MKSFVIINEDGSLTISHPNLDKFGDEEGKRPFSEYPPLQRYEGKEKHLILRSELPKHSDMENHRQRYFDPVDNSVKIDTNWDIQLMPLPLVKARYINKIHSEIEAELEKEEPDPIVLARKQIDVVKAEKTPTMLTPKATLEDPEPKGIQNPIWYDIALDSLDKRVAGGEADKPKIRQKLEALIQAKK